MHVTTSIVLRAVHDTDLKRVLRRLDILEAVEGGKLRCSVCNRPVNMDNLGGLYMDNGEVKVVCNNISCLYKVAEYTAMKMRAKNRSGKA